MRLTADSAALVLLDNMGTRQFEYGGVFGPQYFVQGTEDGITQLVTGLSRI